MDTSSWKESLRQRLTIASAHSSITDIAKDLDIPRQKLYDFLSKGYLNADDLKSLEIWLDSHKEDLRAISGLSEGSDAPQGSALIERASAWLRQMALMLDAPGEKPSAKAQVLRSSLTYLLEEIVPQLEKSAESENKGPNDEEPDPEGKSGP